mgnify:CR=1 FL=1
MREYIFVFNLDAIVQDKSGEKNCGILEFINDNAQRCYFKQDCIDKNREKTVVAISNSESDIAMMKKADIRIGYGGIKEVMPEILSIVDYVIYEEKKLVDFLGRLLHHRVDHRQAGRLLRVGFLRYQVSGRSGRGEQARLHRRRGDQVRRLQRRLLQGFHGPGHHQDLRACC